MKLPPDKPSWDPDDQDGSLHNYASWMNKIARAAFIQDGHHPEMFWFITEDGQLSGCKFRDDLSTDRKNKVIMEGAEHLKPFGTIHTKIVTAFHPAITAHPLAQRLEFAAANSSEPNEFARLCLMVRMESRMGKENIWISPIVDNNGVLALGKAIESCEHAP